MAAGNLSYSDKLTQPSKHYLQDVLVFEQKDINIDFKL